ncbi:MAG: hypothetical protein ACTSSA_12640 [Candidatus Freyarchaeota archaeon]
MDESEWSFGNGDKSFIGYSIVYIGGIELPTVIKATQLNPNEIQQAPVQLQDSNMFLWGLVTGGVVTLLTIYGVIPALAEWAATAIRRKAVKGLLEA